MIKGKFYLQKLYGLVIGTTIITCLICYNAFKPNAYEVNIGGKCIAYVKDKSKVEAINNDFNEEIKKRFTDYKIQGCIKIDPIVAKESALTNDDTLKNNIINTFAAKVKAIDIFVNGKCIATLASEKEWQQVVKEIEEYYLSKCTLNNKAVVGIKDKIEYVSKETDINDVDSVDNIVKKIKSQENSSQAPYLSIEIQGKTAEEISVSFSKTTSYSSSIPKGQSIIKTKGENGTKIVEKTITFLNSKKEDEKVTKETITKNPVNEVVVNGTQSMAQSAETMALPSRGSISSSFGMRWGRMHEGIDIASPMGSPINAAEEGTVVYAGWEEGYGNVIKIAHANNMETIYGHCSELDVKVNDKIDKGQVIGKVGSTGNSTGPHLHFEVRINGEPINPKPYIYNGSKG